MYTLTLTREERKAIDWVGFRYAHGTELYQALADCNWHAQHRVSDSADELDIAWDGDYDITFLIPECVAWEIHNIGEDCNWLWDCFSPELSYKLNQFCFTVV